MENSKNKKDAPLQASNKNVSSYNNYKSYLEKRQADIEKCGGEILIDKKKNKKAVDWQGKKKKSIELSGLYYDIGKRKKAKRVKYCGDILTYARLKNKALKLMNAYFCKDRLCPLCSWRRSLKIYGHMSKIMDYLEEYKNYRYIFLTLTQKNVTGDELDSEIRKMMKAFKKLFKRKKVSNLTKGYFRALEITYNKKANTYHPHFHIIIAVDKSYFDNPKIYMNQNEWSEYWQKSMKLDYKPIVDVRKSKKINGETTHKKGISEVAKYTVKDSDYLFDDRDLSLRVVEVLSEALRYKRLIGYGGIFKKIHKLLNLDDVNDENVDLINTDNEDELREDLVECIEQYGWSFSYGNYFLISRREKTESDFESNP